MDPLLFGPLDVARNRYLFEGVVSGISSYGNSVGVPTVGGEVAFDECYAENPLVNVMCVGVMPVDGLVLGRASGDGNLAVLLGSSTGRDGIGGVSVLASAGFGDDDQAKRPSVQVGDPFEEKRLIEACLALFHAGLVVGIQDLGGAGLTCATSETASRGGMGMDVDATAVPRREPGMEPFEVMTSESQERMLAIVGPDDLDEVLALCDRWEVRATVVGKVTEGGRLRVLDGWDGAVLAHVPAAARSEDAPLYDRPMAAPAHVRTVPDPDALPAPGDCGAELLGLLADPSIADASWVWSQYDHQLFLNTVEGPGGDAAVLRLAAPGVPANGRGLALSTDGNGRWCAVDPRAGTAMLVAESTLNVACAGACRGLGVPVIGGNVSLYNESRGRDIDPTPVVGTLGIVERLDRRPPGATLVENGRLLLLGSLSGDLGGSRWAAGAGAPGDRLPPLDLGAHAALLALVVSLVADGILTGVHDVSDGGLGVA